MTPKELLQGAGSTERAREVLLNVLDWLSVAIAQQRLLSGDILIPYLADDVQSTYDAAQLQGWNFTSPPSQEDIRTKRDLLRTALAHHILTTNPVIRENTIRYLLNKSMLSANHRPVSYTWAYEMPPDSRENKLGISYMSKVFGGKLAVDWSQEFKQDGETLPQGWYCTVSLRIPQGSSSADQLFLIAMPSPQEMDRGLLVTTPALEHLLNLRNRVEGRLLGFDLTKDVSRSGWLSSVKQILLWGGRN